MLSTYETRAGAELANGSVTDQLRYPRKCRSELDRLVSLE
jgi:hypothetical protein